MKNENAGAVASGALSFRTVFAKKGYTMSINEMDARAASYFELMAQIEELQAERAD